METPNEMRTKIAGKAAVDADFYGPGGWTVGPSRVRKRRGALITSACPGRA